MGVQVSSGFTKIVFVICLFSGLFFEASVVSAQEEETTIISDEDQQDAMASSVEIGFMGVMTNKEDFATYSLYALAEYQVNEWILGYGRLSGTALSDVNAQPEGYHYTGTDIVFGGGIGTQTLALFAGVGILTADGFGYRSSPGGTQFNESNSISAFIGEAGIRLHLGHLSLSAVARRYLIDNDLPNFTATGFTAAYTTKF